MEIDVNSNDLRSIVQWLISILPEIVLASLLASVASLVFAAIQYKRRKTSVVTEHVRQIHSATEHARQILVTAHGDLNARNALFAVNQGFGVGVRNAPVGKSAQRIYGQGDHQELEESPEGALGNAASVKGAYGTGSYSSR
jgi:hypothetical protein